MIRALLVSAAIMIVARATADAGPCGEATGCAVDVPNLFMELGTGIRAFKRQLDPHAVARTTQPLDGDDRERAVLGTLRIGIHLPYGLTPLVEMSYGGETGEGAFVIESLVALGIGTVIPAGRLGFELAGGARTIATDELHSQRGVVEARAVGEWWIQPRLTVEAVVGTSLLERGAWSSTVSLGLHAHAYDRW